MSNNKLVEYIDWSDHGFEKYAVGKGGSFGTLDFDLDDVSGDLFLHLRRNTKFKRDFTLMVPSYRLEELYKYLKDHFEG